MSQDHKLVLIGQRNLQRSLAAGIAMVKSGVTLILTSHGNPVAVMVSYDAAMESLGLPSRADIDSMAKTEGNL